MKTNRSTLTSRVVAAVVGVGIALLIPSLAAAGQVSKEIATAVQHAGFAARSDNIEGVHKHLHHAINCLVGPDGRAFDAHAMNPCKGLGNGAIPDAASTTQKQALKAALKEAEAGLKDNDLLSARKSASLTAAILRQKAS